jgi:hypothetical protein
MTDRATKRPWSVEFAATKTYDLIYSGSRMDGTTIARVSWTGKAEDRANTELIVKAVNSHDALVAALKLTLQYAKENADIREIEVMVEAALEQVK